jgi:hypothetical protein
MLDWLKKYWLALIASALLLAILDGTISSLMTCHPITDASGHAADAKKAEEECTALHGPILIGMEWAAHIAHKYEGLITAVTTIFLAIFTGRLWWSTDQLWKSATAAAKAQSDDTRILQRAYISVVPLGIIRYRLMDRYGCHVGFHNSGNLPATHVTWFMHRKVSTDPVRKDFSINEQRFEGDLVIPQHITAPKGTMSFSKRFIERFNQGNDGRNRFVYVWGEVRYTDGFGKRRWIKFCHRYNLAPFNVSYGVPVDFARYHEHGNHTDEG